MTVLLLTAKSDIDDRILGLDLGADDYLFKPFNTGELSCDYKKPETIVFTLELRA